MLLSHSQNINLTNIQYENDSTISAYFNIDDSTKNTNYVSQLLSNKFIFQIEISDNANLGSHIIKYSNQLNKEYVENLLREQKSTTHNKEVKTTYNIEELNHTPQNYSDTLILAKQIINELDYFNLKKQEERFIYLSRTKSYKLYPELLSYIQTRINTLNHEE